MAGSTGAVVGGLADVQEDDMKAMHIAGKILLAFMLVAACVLAFMAVVAVVTGLVAGG